MVEQSNQPQFTNVLTNQPIAITDITDASFNGAGPGATGGLVPSPGATPHSPPYYLGDDGAFHVIPTASIGSLTPSPSLDPSSTSYTVQSTDFMRFIVSLNSPGTLTLTLPPTLPDGFIFYVAVNTNSVILTSTTFIAFPNGQTNGGSGPITLSRSLQIVCIVYDGGTFYVLGNQSSFSSSAAGLVPASGGGTTTFLRADGTFTITGRTLINTLTASNSATLDDTTSITGTYNDYEIVLENILPASSAVFQLQIYSSGLQTSSYSHNSLASVGGASAINNSTTENYVRLTNNAMSTSASGASGTIRLYNTNSTTTKKLIDFHLVEDTGGGTLQQISGGGMWTGGNGAVSGIRISFSTGNITSGVVKIIGLN